MASIPRSTGIGSLAPNEPDYLKSGLAEIANLAKQAETQYRPTSPKPSLRRLRMDCDPLARL